MILARQNYDINMTNQSDNALLHTNQYQVDNLAEAISAMKGISMARGSPRDAVTTPHYKVPPVYLNGHHNGVENPPIATENPDPTEDSNEEKKYL